MRRPLAFASVTEGLTGLLLLAFPEPVVALLLGGDLTGSGVAAARVAGFAILALGVACWPTRESSTASIGMLVYTLLVASYFFALGAGGHASGVLLWPVVAYHAALALALGANMNRRHRIAK